MSAVATLPPQQSLFGATSGEKKDFAAELKKQTVACRVHHEKFGVRKALTKAQTKIAAASFDAEGSAISAAKRLIDTKDPAWRAVSNVRSRASSYWKAVSTPYPEPGIRLLRRGMVETFTEKMNGMRNELREAARALQEKYAELREQARTKLGDLFDPADYPPRVDVEFALEWDFPSIDPPAYLKELHPGLYEQEAAKVRGRFEEAIRLTEQSLATKLNELVAHLVERLTGGVDGKPKVIRDSAVSNLVEFFDAFKAVDLGSNGEIAALVQRAQSAVAGVAADDLRSNDQTRTAVASELSKVRETLDALMINRPNRKFELEEE